MRENEIRRARPWPRPVSQNQKLWRYIDFVKFVAMVENGGLFFPRVTKFPDRHEGWPTEAALSRLKGAIKAFSTNKQMVKNALTSNRRIIEEMRKNALVSCWHMNTGESAAMWALYGGEAKSICLQTTYGKLRTQFPNGIPIKPVKYLDYSRADMRAAAVQQDHFFYKRKSFAHEQELRIVLMDHPKVKECIDFTADKHGAWIKCNLNEIAEKIYVSPNAESWFVNLVRAIAQKGFSSVPVIQSPLYKSPLL